MNPTIETIMSRRSIRKYKGDSVDESTMRLVLAAGCAAPSAMNLRPARFIILDKKRMAELAERVQQKDPFLEAQWAIAVCGDTRGYKLGPEWIADCAAAMENMQIACKALGLGSLWFGVYTFAAKEPAVREFLGVPEGVEVLRITIFGYGAEKKDPNAGVDESKVMIGKWTE